jgi:hypothetical protein
LTIWRDRAGALLSNARAVAEYFSVLDDAAFGGATPAEPKAISPVDPAARYTAAVSIAAVYAYSDNYLVDLKHAVIMDVEATTAIRQAEVGAAKTMLDRTAEQFDVHPSRLVADAVRVWSSDVQGPNQVFQGVRHHDHSNGEKKKRGDDHSDSDGSESTTGPTLGFFRTGDRDVLDQESDHIAAGGQHHANPKAHEGDFERRIIPRYPSGLVGDGEITEKR